MISNPSVFGKLPGYGDFVRHNASLDQVDVWRTWFELAAAPSPRIAGPGVQPPGRQALRRAQPCYFLLNGRCLGFPASGGYVIGVMAASHDRVGRHYPIVVWQSTSAHWAGQLLATPARWLTDLAEMLHEQVKARDQLDFSTRVDTLWLEHCPRWRDRIGASLRRLADARLNIGELAGPSVRVCKGLRADWPQSLYHHGTFGCFWQAGAGSVLAIDGVPAIRNIVAAMS